MYRPMHPRKLRKMLQAKQLGAVVDDRCKNTDPATVRQALLSLINLHQPSREEYVDLFIHNTVGELSEAAACTIARWLVWDDINHKFEDGDTSLPPRPEARRELLIYIGTVLKHNNDIRYLDFPV